MKFKIGDRVVIKAYEHQRRFGYCTNGEIISSNYNIDGTYQIRWDIPEGHRHYKHLELYGVDKRKTTWIDSTDIELEIQYLRDIKLNELGV